MESSEYYRGASEALKETRDMFEESAEEAETDVFHRSTIFNALTRLSNLYDECSRQLK